MTHYKDDSYALHTDLYQINMAYTYWKDGIHNRRSVLIYIFESFHLRTATLFCWP